jgi:hypothetical protein
MATAPEVELRADIAGRLEIKLSRSAQILGQIVDDGGRPLAGALVTVSAQSGLGIQDLAVLPGSLPLASEAANLPAEALARKGRLRSVASDAGGRVVLPICRRVSSRWRSARPRSSPCTRARSRSTPDRQPISAG